jgi:Transposase IS4
MEAIELRQKCIHKVLKKRAYIYQQAKMNSGQAGVTRKPLPVDLGRNVSTKHKAANRRFGKVIGVEGRHSWVVEFNDNRLPKTQILASKKLISLDFANSVNRVSGTQHRSNAVSTQSSSNQQLLSMPSTANVNNESTFGRLLNNNLTSGTSAPNASQAGGLSTIGNVIHSEIPQTLELESPSILANDGNLNEGNSIDSEYSSNIDTQLPHGPSLTETGEQEVDGYGDEEDDEEEHDADDANDGSEDVNDSDLTNSEHGMPPASENEHTRRYAIYESEKKKLIDDQCTFQKLKKKQVYTWKVVDQNDDNFVEYEENKQIGLRGFDFSKFDAENHPYAKIFLMLYPSDSWVQNLSKLNERVVFENNYRKHGKKKITRVSPKEWWTFHAIIIVSAQFRRGGSPLFQEECEGMLKNPPLRDYMSFSRFKIIRGLFPYAFHDENKADPWYPVDKLVRKFNENRSRTISASVKKAIDESMSAFKPQTSTTGNLPHLSYISRKPEPLGTEFKVVNCSETLCMLYIEVQKGKEAMRAAEGSKEFNVTAGCSMRLMKGTKDNVGAVPSANSESGEGESCPRRGLYVGDSWFASVTTAEVFASYNQEYIGIIKTNHAGFPKKDIENIMETWPSGTNIVFHCKSPNGPTLRAIGYKYNSKRILSFVMTDSAGSIGPGSP